MKKILFALFALLIGACAAAQHPNGYPQPKMSMSGKWGYISASGVQLIRPKYDTAMPFQQGYAAVEKDGKWGFINPQGRTICKMQYQIVRDFNLGFALVKKDGKWGAINTEGELVVPCQYDKEGDLANVKQMVWKDKEGKTKGTVADK